MTPKKRKVIFLGRKVYAAKALLYLIKNDIEIAFVSAPEKEEYEPNIAQVAEKWSVPLVSSKDIYTYLSRKKIEVDLVISYLFWEKIRQPLIVAGRNGCVNYHPAILPGYRGLGGYNVAILENLAQWGSTVHYIDSEKIDAGPIIHVQRFSINAEKQTAWSLEKKTQQSMYRQFQRTILGLMQKKTEKIQSNIGGKYFKKADYDMLKRITTEDSLQTIRRKVRAFWFPPYDGAFIEIAGERFTIVTSEILKEVANRL